MKPRDIVLILSAVIIVGLVKWRLHRDEGGPSTIKTTTSERRLAPRFELYDQNSQLVKFERYLGRTRILLLFIADSPVAAHPLVQQLMSNHTAIEDAEVQVVIVGTATPFATREAEKQRGEPYPFPVLTDINQQTPEPVPTHRQWGLAGDEPTDIREGLFLIDRDGTVPWFENAPRPESAPSNITTMIVNGDWPAE